MNILGRYYSVGNNFNDATTLLNTFELASPIGNFEKKFLNNHDDVEGAGGGYLNDDDMDISLVVSLVVFLFHMIEIYNHINK